MPLRERGDAHTEAPEITSHPDQVDGVVHALGVGLPWRPWSALRVTTQGEHVVDTRSGVLLENGFDLGRTLPHQRQVPDGAQ